MILQGSDSAGDLRNGNWICLGIGRGWLTLPNIKQPRNITSFRVTISQNLLADYWIWSPASSAHLALPGFVRKMVENAFWRYWNAETRWLTNLDFSGQQISVLTCWNSMFFDLTGWVYRLRDHQYGCRGGNRFKRGDSEIWKKRPLISR